MVLPAMIQKLQRTNTVGILLEKSGGEVKQVCEEISCYCCSSILCCFEDCCHCTTCGVAKREPTRVSSVFCMFDGGTDTTTYDITLKKTKAGLEVFDSSGKLQFNLEYVESVLNRWKFDIYSRSGIYLGSFQNVMSSRIFRDGKGNSKFVFKSGPLGITTVEKSLSGSEIALYSANNTGIENQYFLKFHQNDTKIMEKIIMLLGVAGMSVFERSTSKPTAVYKGCSVDCFDCKKVFYVIAGILGILVFIPIVSMGAWLVHVI